jgi:hypothetical protein
MSKKTLPPLDVATHNLFIQWKIETIAEEAGVSPEDRLSLESMLKALPRPERRRVRLFLQGVKAQSESQAVQQAADDFLSLATKAWG